MGCSPYRAGCALAGGLRLPSPPPVIRPPASTLRADLREIVSNRAVAACWIATFFSTYAWGSLFAFFPLYARDAGISVVHTGLIFTSQAAANALFRIPVGALSDRTGRRERYILFGNLLFSLAITAVGRFRDKTSFYLLFIVVGAAMAATFTAIGAVLSESVPTRIRGLAMGGYNTCIYGGFALSAATLGIVIATFGYGAGFAVAGGCCAAATLAFAILFPRTP